MWLADLYFSRSLHDPRVDSLSSGLSGDQPLCDVNGLHLAHIAGIDVRVDWSLLIVFLLIVSSLAMGLFPAWHPDWGSGLAWLTAIAAALLFFGSVLAHELSHALMGRRQGIAVRRITLFVFGGMAHMEHEPHRWRAELWMAIVGPFTSLVIGSVCLLIVELWIDPADLVSSPDGATVQALLARLPPLPTLLLWLGQVNIVLALFNLVPGFPLDGGRVLRAVLWGVTGDMRRATRWASAAGQAFAWVLIIAGFSMMLGVRIPVLGTGFASGVWIAFIGWFLNNAALVSYRQLLTREALQDVPVSRLMMTRFASVTPDLSVEALVEEHVVRTGQRAFPVERNGRLAGIVCLRDIQQLPRQQRATSTVADIMTPAERIAIVHPEDDALDALETLARRNVNQLPVVEADGTLRGLLRREDVLRWLALHRDEQHSRRIP